ncbi:EAL domain-containing protein [Methylobacterium sp. J-001]|uniref:EAL domain-containing protein n=1 Tax=Methylobacterium sp. J-001 TaxID=2836609 RepID=UPI001FBB0F36|nr:EAL domain-containing protein [Methylobacterium sp. J-001]MCJ2116539.1 EAL domain-containing protein [Methylobacterium sp. J-001]
MSLPPTKVRKPGIRANSSVSGLLTDAQVQAVFQPIENLQTGEIVGLEALARLALGDQLLSPASFLPGLSLTDRTALFREMLRQAIALQGALPCSGSERYVAVNVEVPLVLSDGFLHLVHSVLDQYGPVGEGAIVLELLEGHATTDCARMSKRLHAIRALGIRVALDDIGSAYSSLINLRDLPVDIMKLDQSFARGLGDRPRDLHFALSLQSLARSIGKRLVVEGVETVEIRDALRVLGVDLGQGYGIARPMPGEAVAAWLAGRPEIGDFDKTPTSLLGAYAGHLRVVEACRTLMGQPLPIAWEEASKDPHACSIGVFFDRQGLHETVFGRAHKRFHEVMALYEADPRGWHNGAEDFRQELERALKDPSLRFRCEAVAA